MSKAMSFSPGIPPRSSGKVSGTCDEAPSQKGKMHISNAADLHIVGMKCLGESFVLRQPVMPVFNDLMKDLDTPQYPILLGAIGMALELMGDARLQGITFKSSDRTMHEMLQRTPSQIRVDLSRSLAKGDRAAYTKILTAVAGALDSLRTKPYVPKFERNPEPAPGQTSAPSGPIEVKVVSAPARRTSTRVEYNAAGDIVASQSVEIDAID